MAERFVSWLGVSAAARWLDVGCGTGALAGTIAELAAPTRVAGVDPSPGFIAAASRHLGRAADLHVGHAEALPFVTDEFDAAVTGLALNFVREPASAVAELRRVTRPGGVVAAYVWDYASRMEMIRIFWDVAVALDPAAAALDQAARFPLCAPGPLDALFTAAGLGDVEVAPLDIPTVFGDFADYWRPLLGGQGTAPSYVASLTGSDRARLEAALRTALPVTEGGIALCAGAWAVKGVA